MAYAFLSIRRLRVMQSGRPVYDQKFHDGVNIIRGENGSGKSTIADFMFYVLGGEFDDWKDSAKSCDEVQADIETQSGRATLRRPIGSKLEPIWLFFGSFEQAAASPFEGWQKFSIRRHGLDLSFSQVLFRLCGIPEAISIRSSNVTSHQLLRLMYADQRTPAPRLFRFESFDTREIRVAVSDLMIGVNGYELYDIQQSLRDLKGQFNELKRDLDALFAVLPSRDGLIETKMLEHEIADLNNERERLLVEIKNIDQQPVSADTKVFIADRQREAADLRILNQNIDSMQESLTVINAEVLDINDFIAYLEDVHRKLKLTSDISFQLGQIEFTHCPSCLRALDDHVDQRVCVLCSEPLNEEEERSKFAHIVFDTELQIRDNKTLLASKVAQSVEFRTRIREANGSYKSKLASFVAKFGGGNSPRDRYLAERNLRLGSIAGEIRRVENLLEVAAKIDDINYRRAEVGSQIDNLEAREKSLLNHTYKRRSTTNQEISDIGSYLLRHDLPRQEEFISCKNVELLFGDDAVTVDGKMNFAESSNVVAKNAAILSLVAAAALDVEMWHPRFTLFDNIEDKGMEMLRSHNFQKLIVYTSNQLKLRHQIIFTTSMIDPELDLSDYCVGERYTRENRTLKLHS